MSELTTTKSGALADYKPERHRLKVAALDYGIEEAKRIKNWPALEEAVAEKIEEQHKFVSWWTANVSSGYGGDRSKYRDRGTCSLAQAEELTGMRQQRVSDLKNSLDKLDLYRQCLLGPQYRRAHLREGDARTLLNKGEVEWYPAMAGLGVVAATLGQAPALRVHVGLACSCLS